MVANWSPFYLAAPPRIYRLLMKEKFNPKRCGLFGLLAQWLKALKEGVRKSGKY